MIDFKTLREKEQHEQQVGHFSGVLQTGGQARRVEADWLRAMEFFLYGVGLEGRSTVACFSPLIKGHDIGHAGMSPPVQAGGTCDSGGGARRTFVKLQAAPAPRFHVVKGDMSW